MNDGSVDLHILITHFERRHAADPSSRAFLPLADAYLRAGRRDDARRVLRAGVARHPGFVSALVALGRLLHEDGDEAAGEPLTRALDRDPNNTVALRLLAERAAAADDWPQAVALLQRLLRLEPEDGQLRDSLTAARRRLEAAPAPELAEPAKPPPLPSPAATPAPASGLTTLTLADLYLRQGHREKAREILTRIAAAEPGRADVQARLEALRAEA